MRDRGPGCSICSLVNRYRGNEIVVGSNKDISFNDRTVFVVRESIVVAGDCAGSDIHVLSNGCITDVRQMGNLAPCPQG